MLASAGTGPLMLTIVEEQRKMSMGCLARQLGI
jgi:hypothetical protein